MESHIGNIMTLSNSIIGVSILAMPFCFKQCGIILSIVLLLASSIVTRLACHFLLKSAIMARRRTFELLAFHAFGPAGKFMVELGIIGFLMGTCIAFFVIIGDLGPAIISKIMGTTPTDTLRTSILIGVAFFCVLPLGLLKNVDSLHSVCTATIGFYFCLVLKTISESTSHFISGDWLSKVELWRPIGVLQCLPIFAMALSCQTQLFEIYEIVVNPTLDKMNYIVRMAINICVAVYICVGFFGYTAFANQPFAGNILMSFSESSVTEVMKIGFVLSVAFSFPLVIFPCRASLYSLLFKKGYTPYEGTSNYIPETKFKFLTALIITTSLIIGILIPNIEVVLGLLGSTIGTMICLIFPVTCFICISTKNTNERLLAQILLFVGVIVMVMGTYANLYAMEQINEPVKIEKTPIVDLNNDIMKKIESEKLFPAEPEFKNIEIKEAVDKTHVRMKEKQEDIRLEPPQPVEPQDEVKKINVIPKEMEPKIEEKINKPDTVNDNQETDKEKINAIVIKKIEETITETVKEIEKTNVKVERETTKKTEEVDVEAIKKEETELQEEEKSKVKEDKDDEKQKAELLKTLEEHKKEQEDLIKEQKELIQELKKEKQELKEKQKNDNNVEQAVRRKAASQILEIAKKAIEQLAPESISKHSLIIQDNVNNKQELSKINENKKPEEKKNKTPVIAEPIAKKIMDFAKNNDVPNKKNVKNINFENSIPNGISLIPLPMAVKNNLNENKISETKNNNTAINNSQLLTEINSNEKQNKISQDKPSQLIAHQEEIRKIVEKQEIEKQTNEIIEKKNEQSPNKPVKSNGIKLDENVNENNIPNKNNLPAKGIIPNANIIPAKRDILANEENTDNNLRIKRDAEDIIKKEHAHHNEKCELTENNNLDNTESLLKLNTEVLKSDILKLESNNLIQSMQIQLQSDTLHLKRK